MPTFKPRIRLQTASAIVIANMIGTGVFTSLGFQALQIKSGFVLLALWAVGGLCALCGALCYGELGASMPRSGGEFHYLSKIYHPALGFLAGWVSVTVGFAAPIAAAAMAMGKYASQVFPGINALGIATVVVVLVALVHINNIQFSSYFQNIFTGLKILLILSLCACGLLLTKGQTTISFMPMPGDFQQLLSVPFATSLVYVMYAYSGWNAATYIANEIEEPQKNLPKALLIGTALVMALYLLTNFVFLYTAPLDELSGKLEVGYIAATHIFGPEGGKIMALLIAFGLISAISAMTWAGPRVTQSMGEEIPFFRWFSTENKQGIPKNAILIQSALVIAMLWTATFDALITYLSFTLTLSAFLTVLGVFVSRLRFPNLPRPYKTWGYPLTPIIFLAISGWMLVFTLLGKPTESLAGLGTILLGLGIYALTRNPVIVPSGES
jgi:basic amino acid/polyamine antiporter, APA family